MTSPYRGPAVVAFALVLHACSLEGIAGGPVLAPDGATSADGGQYDGSGSMDGGEADAAVGCPGCEPLITGETHPTELLINGDDLVWIDSWPEGHVKKRNLQGGQISTDSDHVLASGRDLAHNSSFAVFALGSDGEMRRFLTYSTCVAGKDTRRMASFGPELLTVKSDGLSRTSCGEAVKLVGDLPVAIAGDYPSAWYALPDGTIASCDGSAGQCASTQQVLATGQGTVRVLITDPTRVFWAVDAPELEIRSLLKSTPRGAPVVLARGVHVKTLLAQSGTLYWTDDIAGTLSQVPVGGGAEPVVRASGLSEPWGLVATSEHLYLAEAGAGRILRLPR